MIVFMPFLAYVMPNSGQFFPQGRARLQGIVPFAGLRDGSLGLMLI